MLSDLYSHTVIGFWYAKMDRPSMTVRMVGEKLAREAGRRPTSTGVDDRKLAGTGAAEAIQAMVEGAAEYSDCLAEAALTKMPRTLRYLYVSTLAIGEVGDPRALLEACWPDLGGPNIRNHSYNEAGGCNGMMRLWRRSSA